MPPRDKSQNKLSIHPAPKRGEPTLTLKLVQFVATTPFAARRPFFVAVTHNSSVIGLSASLFPRRPLVQFVEIPRSDKRERDRERTEESERESPPFLSSLGVRETAWRVEESIDRYCRTTCICFRHDSVHSLRSAVAFSPFRSLTKVRMINHVSSEPLARSTRPRRVRAHRVLLRMCEVKCTLCDAFVLCVISGRDGSAG